MPTMTIAENLPRLRKAKGLSQVTLAKKAGVSQQLISRLESGVDLSSKKLPEIARAIGVSIFEIDENYRSETDIAPIRTEAEILATLERIEGLTQTDVEVAFSVIGNALRVNRASRTQSGAEDRPRPATSLHREVQPARK